MRKHGHTSPANPGRVTPEYTSWRSMKNRCLGNDPSHLAYKGMEIDPAWVNDFAQFIADMGARPQGTTLDRIDNSKGYVRGNCRWATYKEQQCNRRSNRYRGMSVEDVAQLAGINVNTVRSRLARGHSPEAALTPKGREIRCGHNGDCVRGESNKRAKLTEEIVLFILTSPKRAPELARELGVTRHNINAIRRRETWRHVNV